MEESAINKLANYLSEHFGIPCDFCQSCFGNGDCPSEITKCNGFEHWKLLLERIIKDEES